MAKPEDAAAENAADAGRFSYDGLDRVIHEKARLGVLASLVAHPKGLPFGELKQLCALTDGNLSRHLQVLEEEKLVEIEKRFEGKRPLTTVRLSSIGRQRFLEYVSVLERVVRDAAAAAERGPQSATAKGSSAMTPAKLRLKPA